MTRNDGDGRRFGAALFALILVVFLTPGMLPPLLRVGPMLGAVAWPGILRAIDTDNGAFLGCTAMFIAYPLALHVFAQAIGRARVGQLERERQAEELEKRNLARAWKDDDRC